MKHRPYVPKAAVLAVIACTSLAVQACGGSGAQEVQTRVGAGGGTAEQAAERPIEVKEGADIPREALLRADLSEPFVKSDDTILEAPAWTLHEVEAVSQDSGDTRCIVVTAVVPPPGERLITDDPDSRMLTPPTANGVVCADRAAKVITGLLDTGDGSDALLYRVATGEPKSTDPEEARLREDTGLDEALYEQVRTDHGDRWVLVERIAQDQLTQTDEDERNN